MKKVVTFVALSVLCFSSAFSQTVLGIANHLGVDVNVGTTGIGFELSTPITQFVQARAGLSFMPGINFDIDADVTGTVPGQNYEYSESVTLSNSIKRTQGSVIFNIYPGGNKLPFFIAVGGYFGGKELIKMKGQVPASVMEYGSGHVEIGDYELPVDRDGYVSGTLRVNSFRPYFGIGSGRPCPGGRLNFMWEVGVQVQGKPKVYDGTGRSLEIKELDNDDTYNKVMKYLKVYPVIKFTLSGRIF